MKTYTIKKLLKAGVHLGHHKSLWDPKVRQYLFGVRNNTHIIDLEQTLFMLRRVLNVVENVVKNEGTILFIGKKSKQYFINNKWYEIKGKFKKDPKMPFVPDLLFILDINKNNIYIKNALKLNIPTIAIIDTNCNPEGITYPIPGNNDSAEAIELYCGLITNAINNLKK